MTVYIGKDWPFGNDAQMVTTEGPSAAAVDFTAIFGGAPCKTEIYVSALKLGVRELMK